jgi:hypothetical protein
VVERSVENSLVFGLYRGKEQVGFAGVVTDRATFAYLADVFVVEELRGQRLGRWMMEVVLSRPTCKAQGAGCSSPPTSTDSTRTTASGSSQNPRSSWRGRTPATASERAGTPNPRSRAGGGDGRRRRMEVRPMDPREAREVVLLRGAHAGGNGAPARRVKRTDSKPGRPNPTAICAGRAWSASPRRHVSHPPSNRPSRTRRSSASPLRERGNCETHRRKRG